MNVRRMMHTGIHHGHVKFIKRINFEMLQIFIFLHYTLHIMPILHQLFLQDRLYCGQQIKADQITRENFWGTEVIIISTNGWVLTSHTTNGGMRNAHKIADKKPQGKSHIEDMGTCGCIISKWNLKEIWKWGLQWTDSGCDPIMVIYKYSTFGFYKNGIMLLASWMTINFSSSHWTSD
jgi:hypothetical protein